MTAAIAHRGDPLLFRENTLPALLSAVASGADMVEIDVHLTADEQVVVCHDRTLERLWGCDNAVEELTLADVRRVTTQGYTIPTLPEVLQAVPGDLMVDLPDPRAVRHAVMDTQGADAMNRCLFVTGHLDALFELRELSTRARLGLTWSSSVLPDEGVLNALQVECLNPCWVYLSERLVASAHERGLEVSTWTVDRPADMRLMLRLGVDSVVTNDVRTFVMTRMGA